MKKINVLFIVLGFGLAACSGATVNEGDVVVEELPYTDFQVFLSDDGYQSVSLFYNGEDGFTDNAVPLVKTDGWWSGSISNRGGLEFYFLIDGTLNYPGGSKKNFRLSILHPEAFIQNGIMYTENPANGNSTNELTVLTLNLHTYQEDNPGVKLDYIADLIAAADVDLVAFQECAQHKDTNELSEHYGIMIREDQMMDKIVLRLKDTYGLDYDYFWDWAHYGWDVWEEGVAVLGLSGSLIEYESQYMSAGTSKYDINSRMAAYGAFNVEGVGRVNLFSTHLSWGAPQAAQMDRMKTYAAGKVTDDTQVSLICGDFNADYLGEGYNYFMQDQGYKDAYLESHPSGGFDRTIQGGSRIDYQFINSGSEWQAIMAQRVFTQIEDKDDSFKRVSDHYGTIVRYQKVGD